MSMGMSLSMRQIQECVLCGESVEEHRDDCPQKMLDGLVAMRRHITCGHCHKPAVGLNRNDFFECRECHTQFTSGILMGEDLEKTVLFDYEQNEVINVFVLKEKG